MDDFSTGVDTFHGDLFRFDTTRDKWKALTPAGATPHPRAFGAAASNEGRFYIYGGAHFGPFFSDFIAFDDIWSYSPISNTWTLVQQDNAGPSGRAGAKVWIIHDKLYVFGGVDQFFTVHNDLWTFDLDTNLWSELIADGAAGSPPARHIAQGGSRAKHGKLTIYGGESIDPFTFTFSILGDTWQYDLSSNTWTDATPAPAHNIDPPRNYAASGIVGNVLVLQGGDVPGGEDGCGSPFPQNVTEELWAYNLTHHKWRQLDPDGDPLARIKRSGYATIGDRMYVFSGWDFQCPGGVGPGQVWNLDVWSYDH